MKSYTITTEGRQEDICQLAGQALCAMSWAYFTFNEPPAVRLELTNSWLIISD